MTALEHAVRANTAARAILERAPALELPSWYLGAGAIAQSVWNQLHSFVPTFGIADYDLVYFDADDLTETTERTVESRVTQVFADLGVRVDVTNEARVHTWYGERFGKDIPSYRSTEHAVSTWPTTATSVAVRQDQSGFVVCAPFGLSDIFSMLVRPNKAIVTREVYESKATRWLEVWPSLTVSLW